MAERDPLEIELKLGLPDGARARLEALPALQPPRAGRPERRDEVTTYFDTPDLALAGMGIALRVRLRGTEHIQAVKIAGAAGVASRRGEWEWPVAGSHPDLALLAGTPAAGALTAEAAARLRPVFVTEIERTAWQVTLDGGASAELVIDEGRIRAGRRSLAVRELEIEWRAGPVAAIYRLALELHAAVPLAIAAESKAARGYRLRSGSAPPAVKAEKPPLPADIAFGPALHAIIGGALGHLLSDLPAADSSPGGEHLHQMRVAIRRLRSALVLVEDQVEPVAAADFGAALRQLGRILGAARDWDVFLAETLPAAIAGGVEPAWLGPVEVAARAALGDAQREAAAALAAPGFTALVLGLAAWTEGDLWRPAGAKGGKLACRPLAKLAPKLLDRLADKVARRGRHPRRLDAAGRHALRKSMKKLRYGVEFLTELYGHKKVKRYLDPCEALQDVLGTINDAAATLRLAEALDPVARPELAPGIGALARWNETRDEAAKHRLAKAWRRFGRAKRFWRE